MYCDSANEVDLHEAVWAKSPEAWAMWEQRREAINKGISDADAFVKAYNYLMEEGKESKRQTQPEEMREAASGKYSAKEMVEKKNEKLPANAYCHLSFGEQVKKLLAGNVRGDGFLLLGRTPKILRDIGLSDLPMMMNQDHARKLIEGQESSINDDHILSDGTIENLPMLIADPVAVVLSTDPQYADSTVNVIIGAKNKNGDEVFAAVALDKVATSTRGRNDINKVATVFGSDSAKQMIVDAVANTIGGKKGILYINKKKADPLYRSSGEQKTGGALKGGLIATLADAGMPVKSKSKKQTDTQQFKRWFGGSKVVDAEGNPLIMYHGTSEKNGEFYVFDQSKAKKKGGLGFKTLGKGNYFTSKRLTGAERYGSRVIEAYLSIEKPLEVEMGKTFRETAAEVFGINAESMSHDELQVYMRKQGYDGVIKYNTDVEIAIAVTFDSNQIKSATDNVGLFDKRNPDIRYSYAGEYARTANVARYADAKRLEEEGKTPSEIYSQTGWYKGMDGKWPFEIDDSRATLRQVKVTNKTRLADIMEHDLLFDSYPALANLKVALSDLMTGSQNASYMGDRISLPSEAPMGNHALRKSLTRGNGDDDAA